MVRRSTSKAGRTSRSALRAPRLLVPVLLRWFGANARDLPWRHTRDPYAIWVSEIMLQQTQVKTVVPYWERWMRALPTIESLAKAKAERIHKLWEGLGYYTRVRNMQKAAQQICAGHSGKFPENFDAIRALPGIGRYTAGAIASIAFNQPTPILDGNIIRVLTRLHGIAEDPHEKKTTARLWQLAKALVADASRLHSRRRIKDEDDFAHCSHLNQSLMELGAVICTPRSPTCSACPIAKHCVALAKNQVDELPLPKRRETVTPRRFLAFVIEHSGRYLVQQRADGVVNGHLWEFPNHEVSMKASAAGIARKYLGVKHVSAEELCVIKHSITRYRYRTEAYRVRLDSTASIRPVPDGTWRSLAQLAELPFASAHRQIVSHLELPASISSKRLRPVRRLRNRTLARSGRDGGR